MDVKWFIDRVKGKKKAFESICRIVTDELDLEIGTARLASFKEHFTDKKLTIAAVSKWKAQLINPE